MADQIANGESGLSVRTKLNTLLTQAETNANAADTALGYGKPISFASRAELVTWASTNTPINGREYRAGGLSYLGETGATAIADLPGLLENFSAKTENNLSDLADTATARTNLGLGTAATTSATAYATAAQGAKADSAQQPPAEGAFVDGDKTKLNGVEANADVTDTANVTAAGALMDSELANVAAVKAINQSLSTGAAPSFQYIDIANLDPLPDTVDQQVEIARFSGQAGTSRRNLKTSVVRRAAGTTWRGTSLRIESNVDASEVVQTWQEFSDSDIGSDAGRAIAWGRGGLGGPEWMRVNDSGLEVKNGALKVGPTINADKPFLNISNLPQGNLPKNHVFIRQTTSERGDNNAVQIQRVVDSNDGHVAPSALKVLSVLNNNNGQAENAVSAVIDSYTNTAGPGVTALNGQINKHGRAGAHFGGHFQVKDYNIYALATDVTASLGMEINLPSIGLDDPSQKYGLRRGIELIARTNQEPANWNTAGGNDGDAEIGCAIKIRTDNITNGGWRYGLAIDDVDQSGTGIIKYGVNIATSGDYGLRLEGNAHAGAAIGMQSGAKIEMGIRGGTSPIFMMYNEGTDKIEFYKAGVLKASIDMGAGASGLDMN